MAVSRGTRRDEHADFTERDRIRTEVCSPFLIGRGLEIGATARPTPPAPGSTCRLYEVRSEAQVQEIFGPALAAARRPAAQMANDFPAGADFLVAFNVLEHAPDPIGMLLSWHRVVRDGAVVALSLPDKNSNPDALRLEPPFSHLLEDFLLDRGADAFESREHVLSNGLVWPKPVTAYASLWQSLQQRLAELLTACRPRRPPPPMLTRTELLNSMFQPGLDIHWHSFSRSLAHKTVLAACAFGGMHATLLKTVDFTQTTPATRGDIVLVYRLHEGVGPCTGFDFEAGDDIRMLEGRLRAACERVAGIAGPMAGSVLAAGSRRDGGGQRPTPYPPWIDRLDRPASVVLPGPFRRERGPCFLREALITRGLPDTAAEPRRSRLRLFENGVALGPPHARHDSIRSQGRGRYSHWHDSLYFAASDNSDPNTNGRVYTACSDEHVGMEPED